MPLATALCKNLPAENTQRQLSRPKPTRVAVPIEEEEYSSLVEDNILAPIFINNILPKVAVQWAALLLHIWKVLDFSSETNYPDQHLSWSSSVLSFKFQASTSNCSTTAFFDILPLNYSQIILPFEAIQSVLLTSLLNKQYINKQTAHYQAILKTPIYISYSLLRAIFSLQTQCSPYQIYPRKLENLHSKGI